MSKSKSKSKRQREKQKRSNLDSLTGRITGKERKHPTVIQAAYGRPEDLYRKRKDR